MIISRIAASRIIPVIALESAADALPLCRALADGGLHVAEITFRTAAAREALELIARELPEFALGAGTVTQLHEVESAANAGAQFAVAPGFNRIIVRRAKELGLPFFPGICTPSDMEAALEEDCRVLKFFPAEAFGGVATLKALFAPYKHRRVQFIPTGGIDAKNLLSYLSTPGVLAIGGSWMASPALIQAKKWEAITALTREALAIVAQAK